MIEALSTSDWHLEGMDKHFVNATHIQLREIDRIYQYAVSKGIKHIFVPGDISETPKMRASTYMQLLMFFKKYDGLVTTHYVGGNHDRDDKDTTSCDLLKMLSEQGFLNTLNVHLQPVQERIDGSLINFCAWPCPASMSTTEGAINMAHITVAGAVGDNGMPLRASHDFAVHDKDYTISGHIHQYQHMKTKRTIYNGNPYQKNFGEALPKGFVHFRAETEKKKIKMRHRFIDNRPQFQLHTVRIDSPEDFQKLTQSNSIRYKLLVDSEVLVPSDLRVQYPNITGGIFTTNRDTGKQEKRDVDEVEFSPVISRVKPQTGLKEYLSSVGHNKKDIKNARAILQEAMDHLGISN